jgi:hypothetical protein
VLVIDRAAGTVAVSLFDTKSGKKTAVKINENGTPVATPESAVTTIQTGDKIAWGPDSARVVVSIAGEGLFLIGTDASVSPLSAPVDSVVTALTWSLTGQSIGLGLWNGKINAASIDTINVQSPGSEPTQVLALGENDGRFVRSLVWGSEKVGLVFALRSATANYSASNDLYFLPRFGQSMQLLASAGVAAPIAVVDQVALAKDGATVAFTVLVPGDVGLRFHSVWVTNATSPAPVQANTTGIRRVAELGWTTSGLVIVGTRRVLNDGKAFQLTVVERLSGDAPESIANDRSPATPVGSPAASPVASPVDATPQS